MRLRSLDIMMGPGFKSFEPFKLNLYKGTQVLTFIDEPGNPMAKLIFTDEFSDEFEDRVFCFYVADGGTEVPAGAKYIDICKGKYWTPFALFEITGCEIEDQE